MLAKSSRRLALGYDVKPLQGKRLRSKLIAEVAVSI